MIVRIRDTKYRVRWIREPGTKSFTKVNAQVDQTRHSITLTSSLVTRTVFDTTAILDILNPSTDEWITIHDAVSKQDPRDIDNKRIGKKNSLAALLRKAALDKDDRKVFWDEFLRVMGSWR